MNEVMTNLNLAAAIPELIMAIGGMLLLMVGVFGDEKVTGRVTLLTAFLLVVTLIATLAGPGKATAFNGMFLVDSYGRFMKSLVLIGSLSAVAMSGPYMKREGLERFEYPVLIVFAALGMMMMISAGSLLSLYVGLELQSLSLYVLAAFARDQERSTEAGLKYFVLGALSSGMLLYGISLIYGFTGTVEFSGIADILGASEAGASLGLLVGIVFLVAGLAFKVSAVPFHMWTPDVYEGAPTPVTAFFAIAPKIAAMALFLRVILTAFNGVADDWQQLIIFISVGSMILGAFAALVQSNIKRLMAYSSIGHVGYALIGLAAGTQAGVQAVLVYMAIYLTMTVGAFAAILRMRGPDGMVEDIDDLAGLARTRPMLALALGIFMFSLAGIPLLAGFFGKWYIFVAAVKADLVPLAIIGLVTSVVGAVYYLRIVKVMYFDEPVASFEKPEGRLLSVVMTVTAALNSPLSFVLIYPLAAAAGIAAASLVS